MSNGITPITQAQIAAAEQQVKSDSYIMRVLIAFDIFANVVFNGHPDETISSRAGRAATEGKWWGTLLSKFLDLFQKDHGPQAEAGDVARAEEVVYLEDNSGNFLTH